MIEFEPIGHLKSCFKERFGTPRQPHVAPSSRASLTLRGDLNPAAALDGLSEFSHVWLIGVFHQNTNNRYFAKIHPPRLEGKKMGLFATRSPHRPNPISLSLARIEKIEGNTLHLTGVDLVDGTPILDIKPYMVDADMAPNASSGWTGGLTKESLTVEFLPSFSESLNDVCSISGVTNEELTNLVREILSQDPRPLRTKPGQSHEHRTDEVFGFLLYDLNILFKVEGNRALAISAERANQFLDSSELHI